MPVSPHLLVGCSTSSYEHHVETCESHDWNEEKPCYTHHHQTGHKGQAQQHKVRRTQEE